VADWLAQALLTPMVYPKDTLAEQLASAAIEPGLHCLENGKARTSKMKYRYKQ